MSARDVISNSHLAQAIWRTSVLGWIAILAFPILSSAQKKAQPETPILYTSPSGALGIETASKSGSGDKQTEMTWVVLTKDPKQRAEKPNVGGELPDDDEFHFSPDDRWLLGLRHGGSGLRDGTLYRILTPLKVELFTSKKSFTELAWANALKLGACKRDFSAEGLYAMMFFSGWSDDSSRLLIYLRGGEEKRDMNNERDGFVYFNTRSGKFELTDYLRKLNRSKADVVACAEPVDPLPSEADLKARLERLDSQLNETFGEVLAKISKENVSVIRDEERDWIKQRDQGVTLYVSLFPKEGRERRRLQFLGDSTATRIEDLRFAEQNYN
jgi:uncharacterized protein YecT (DUF1311 family)